MIFFLVFFESHEIYDAILCRKNWLIFSCYFLKLLVSNESHLINNWMMALSTRARTLKTTTKLWQNVAFGYSSIFTSARAKVKIDHSPYFDICIMVALSIRAQVHRMVACFIAGQHRSNIYNNMWYVREKIGNFHLLHFFSRYSKTKTSHSHYVLYLDENKNTLYWTSYGLYTWLLYIQYMYACILYIHWYSICICIKYKYFCILYTQYMYTCIHYIHCKYIYILHWTLGIRWIGCFTNRTKIKAVNKFGTAQQIPITMQIC